MNKRHDDTDGMTAEQVGVMSFVAGMMLIMIVQLLLRAAGG